MSGAADPASTVTDMMHETKTTEPTNQQLALPNNLHNQQINNQTINEKKNIQKPPADSAELFFKLMLDNIKPKDVWELAGCDFAVS